MKRNLATLLLCIWALGCATSWDARGVFHKVRRGENLFWIARSYGVNLQDLAELNNISDAEEKLAPGQKLYIPPRQEFRYKKLPFEGELSRHIRRPSPLPGREPARMARPEREEGKVAAAEKVYTEHDRFIWPVEGGVISPFGVRRGRRHDGIDIKSKVGTPILAAGAGRVVYAGRMRGYGNLVLLRHNKDFFTAYAHNHENKVEKGEKVKRGTMIGTVGRTGRATGPHLHFEVREGEKARNPLFFLPVGK